MTDLECTEFVQWCLPHLRLRWGGFRKVRGQVCKRLNRRVKALGLSGLLVYKDYLAHHPEEWQILDSICRITISRFYRDRAVFDALRSSILPSLAENAATGGKDTLFCWSAGCSSGEEAYTLQILWKLSMASATRRDLSLRIIATDINDDLLRRARRGCYRRASLRDLPEELVQEAFDRSGEFFTVRKPFAENIEFALQDIRTQVPAGRCDLILCRNLVFTYFEESLQREILAGILQKLVPGGYFVIGIHESLPEGFSEFLRPVKTPGIYQKISP
jgi:chemotaxis protein methyltransferase CheR